MPKRNRNSINTPFARTIIFSGVILLLVAFLLMRLETVSTWIGTKPPLKATASRPTVKTPGIMCSGPRPKCFISTILT